MDLILKSNGFDFRIQWIWFLIARILGDGCGGLGVREAASWWRRAVAFCVRGGWARERFTRGATGNVAGSFGDVMGIPHLSVGNVGFFAFSSGFFKKCLHFKRCFGIIRITFSGEVAEWSKAQDWKSCVLLVGTEGSNPSLSASLRKP